MKIPIFAALLKTTESGRIGGSKPRRIGTRGPQRKNSSRRRTTIWIRHKSSRGTRTASPKKLPTKIETNEVIDRPPFCSSKFLLLGRRMNVRPRPITGSISANSRTHVTRVYNMQMRWNVKQEMTKWPLPWQRTDCAPASLTSRWPPTLRKLIQLVKLFICSLTSCGTFTQHPIDVVWWNLTQSTFGVLRTLDWHCQTVEFQEITVFWNASSTRGVNHPSSMNSIFGKFKISKLNCNLIGFNCWNLATMWSLIFKNWQLTFKI